MLLIAQSIFGLASALEDLGTEEALEEADGLHRRVIEEHPTAAFVEQSEKARNAYSQRLLKSRSVGGFRPDVMMYIADALRTFKRLGSNGTRMLALEIAVLGRSGLDVNDSTSKYKLKALPGQFSGLHLLSIMPRPYLPNPSWDFVWTPKPHRTDGEQQNGMNAVFRSPEAVIA